MGQFGLLVEHIYRELNQSKAITVQEGSSLVYMEFTGEEVLPAVSFCLSWEAV